MYIGHDIINNMNFVIKDKRRLFSIFMSSINYLCPYIIFKKDYDTFKWYVWNTNDYDNNNLEECKFNNGLIHQNLEFDSIIDKDNDL